jgi:hypothetical protein
MKRLFVIMLCLVLTVGFWGCPTEKAGDSGAASGDVSSTSPTDTDAAHQDAEGGSDHKDHAEAPEGSDAK